MYYLIKFYQSGEVTFYNNGRHRDGETVKFTENQIIEVSKQNMFEWIEEAKNNSIKIVVMESSVVCDLS